MAIAVDKLKHEHSEIFEALKEAKELCVTTRSGCEKLMSSRDALLRHLDREDREFYPELRKAAEHDGHLRHILQEFEEDMHEVSQVAHDFFDRCQEGCSGLEFISDFGTFLIMFKDRMTKEERVLFPEYERVCH